MTGLFAASRNQISGIDSSQFGCRAPAGLILEVDVDELLAVVVANDEAGVLLLDGPGRREAASG
jgi:hypothetical protein